MIRGVEIGGAANSMGGSSNTNTSNRGKHGKHRSRFTMRQYLYNSHLSGAPRDTATVKFPIKGPLNLNLGLGLSDSRK